MLFTKFLTALVFATSARAHMDLSFPPAFRSSTNEIAVKAAPNNIDYSMTSPLNADGSNFPCKGYQSDLGTPAGASTATFDQGGQYNITLTGGAVHGGGSCQASLSYDGGKSFNVIHSWIGSCPLSSGEDFSFTVPSDAPTGAAMFAWTWYNKIGNREIYMNCASITIAAGSGPSPAVAFKSRPDLFVANLGNGCTTVETKEVIFPDPGPPADVTTALQEDSSGSYTGTCAAVKGIGGEGGPAPASVPAGSGTVSPATSAASGQSPATTPTTLATSASPLATSASSSSVYSINILPSGSTTLATSTSAAAQSVIGTTSTASASVPTGTGTASGMTTSDDGSCGGTITCLGDAGGSCCSSSGYCGSGPAYCGAGCQPAFGNCDSGAPFPNSTSSSAAASGTGLSARSFRIRY
jgi:hypothetical protein